jgi:hypothetical protein
MGLITCHATRFHDLVAADAASEDAATAAGNGVNANAATEPAVDEGDAGVVLAPRRGAIATTGVALAARTLAPRCFTAADYCAPTPAWALPGAVEAGFDPVDKRHFRKGSAVRNAAVAAAKAATGFDAEVVAAATKSAGGPAFEESDEEDESGCG